MGSKKEVLTEEQLAQTTISSLDSTVGSFENRLQKRLEQQEQQLSDEQALSKARSARVLQALNTVRRALQETQKIKLGSRFSFDLDVNDWNGWPRIELNLIDSILPEAVELGFIVTAHDRKQSGTIEFRTRTGNLLAAASLTDDKELGRIPVLLKKSVRAYLDTVADYVLNPKKEEALLQTSINMEEEFEEVDPNAHRLQNTNLFSDEEIEYDKNQVKHEKEDTANLEVCFDK